MLNFLLKIIRFFQFRTLQAFYFFLHKVILGLMNYWIWGDENWENYVLKHINKYSEKKGEPIIIFDVGANIWQYSSLVNTFVKNRILYSFEPSAKTFSHLKKNTSKFKEYFPNNVGLSDKAGEITLYTAKDWGNGDITNACASLYADNISCFVSENIEEEKIKLDTLDQFCIDNDINYIDYLKIDVEWNELNVLKGANSMLKKNNIEIIQLEFNRCSIASRTFFKDYRDLLGENFYVFRVLGNNHWLYRIKKYDIYLENFTYMNYVFVNKKSNFVSFVS